MLYQYIRLGAVLLGLLILATALSFAWWMN